MQTLTHEAFQQFHIQLLEDFTDQRTYLEHKHGEKGQIRGWEKETTGPVAGSLDTTGFPYGIMARVV